MTTTADRAASSWVPDAGLPRLAPGVELLGTYASSGFKDPPYLACRGDGQMVQLPGLLYLVAQALERGDSAEAAAARISAEIGRGLAPEDVAYLAQEKLRPLGLVAAEDGGVVDVQKVDPLLALKFRTSVVPRWLVTAGTVLFRPLFFPPVVVAVLAGIGVMDGWLFFHHGVAQSVRQTLNQPWFILVALGLVIASAAFHEFGHATACRYGGARPGAMGVGLYLAWPAFYTDVTDAYRLSKGGRLRTDFGGVYFNGIFMLGAWGTWAVTRFEPLLLIIVILHFEVLQQFLPFLRMDGYYMVADLVGVPDLFNRIGPILHSLIPWRPADERATELKPRVRVAVSAWVLVVVPFLLFDLVLILIHLPRVLATGWHAGALQWAHATQAFAEGKTMIAVASTVEFVVLVIPLIGIVLMLGRVGHRAVAGSWAWSAGSVARRGTVVLSGIALVGFLGFTWWPRGEYRPIRPGERATIQEVARTAASTLGRARPAVLTSHTAPAPPKPLHRAPVTTVTPKARTTTTIGAEPPTTVETYTTSGITPTTGSESPAPTSQTPMTDSSGGTSPPPTGG